MLPAINKVELLESFRDYEAAKTLNEVYWFRLGIDSAIAKLREIKKDLDQEMIRRMKEEGIREIIHDDGQNKTKVYVGHKTSERIKDTSVLIDLLKAGHELAYKALSSGQSAWRIAQVRLLADTLGLDLLEIKTEDTLEIKDVPMAVLENINPK